jgi:hypothetical protein
MGCNILLYNENKYELQNLKKELQNINLDSDFKFNYYKHLDSGCEMGVLAFIEEITGIDFQDEMRIFDLQKIKLLSQFHINDINDTELNDKNKICNIWFKWLDLGIKYNCYILCI